MAQTVSVIIGAEDRERLAAVVGDRNRPQKHVQRARIVLLSAARLPVLTVASQVGVSRPSVWRWQQRFAEAGIEGLLRDKTRKPGKAPLSAETVAKVLTLPCAEAPGEATHWTGRAVARAVGVSLRAVQRIWEAHRLQPHRINVLDGKVVGRCLSHHRHQEFIKFLNAVERAVPTGKVVHAILDNYATHKHPKVTTWLANHPRWVFHFTPTSASWLNAIEGFFSILTRRRLKPGVFKSVADLEAAIARSIREHNKMPKPFVWTKTAEAILAKLQRLPVSSE